jgi:PAS domain S-box-containing protein
MTGTRKGPAGNIRNAKTGPAKNVRRQKSPLPGRTHPRTTKAAEIEITDRDKAARCPDEPDAVFSTLTEPVIIYDASGKIAKANPAAIRSYGFDPVKLRAKSRQSVITRINLRNDDGSQLTVSDLPSSKAATGETVINRRLVFTDSGGRDVTIEASAAPIYKRGTFEGVVVAWHDISEIARREEEVGQELKKAQYALEETVQKRTVQLSKAYDRLLFQIDERQKAEAVLKKKTYDLNERVKEINCLYSIYGIIEKRNLTTEEKLGKIVELIPPAMQYPETACARVVFRGGTFISTDFRETEWRLQSDICISEDVAGAVEVFYRAGKPLEYAGPFLREEVALIDAISKKVAEMAELARTEEEVIRYRVHLEDLIRDRTVELERMNDQLRHEAEEHARAEEKKTQLVRKLEDVNMELSDFAHVISHDLKAPLRAISSLANWIATDYSEKFDAEGKEKVALLLRRVKRMHDFIDAILQYSRIGKSAEERSEVDIGDLVREVIETISPPRNISVTAQEGLPVLFCDRTRIQQVFQNLIGNAVKFMNTHGGEIRVQYFSDDAYHRFSVSDNGPGIEERHFNRIFKIFQTLSPRDEFESTGVGLALVKKIIEMYGGTIWVESVVGQGSTFYFTLPKATTDEKQ